ncbi:uncharacterized protein L201_006559 [Kwoniella dendrophila CBS 6074]|uniref:GPI-anchored wall transfer protein 1 n=1 Tax=Kwoniella dendrophila CBS 6074 TaxID=1295534 RepID=A0AAX4K378_9TREE
MSDYKSAKEAFVSDNPGSSLFDIIAISLVAWTSYILYACSYERFRPSFVFDYLTSGLPLLLGVTIFATRPITFNFIILIISSLAYVTLPKNRRKNIRNNGFTNTKKDKSKGSWLEESDSDEEIAELESSSAQNSKQNTPIKLPSQVVPIIGISSSNSFHSSSSITTNSPINTSTSNSALSSPINLSPDDPFNLSSSTPNTTGGIHSGLNKRKLSPQPSPDNITVNILPTPPFPETDSLDTLLLSSTTNKVDYPSRRSGSIPGRIRVEDEDQNPKQRQKLSFLSIYRAHMMIMTVHCILAVDFRVFPRWLGKCEDFGTSLMDVGVGSFVFSLGIISYKSLSSYVPKTIKQKQPPNSPGMKFIKKEQSDIKSNLLRELFIVIRKSSPTLILGFIRLFMVKGIEYPEHITEYGLHWNFFFTIGLLPIFGCLIKPLRKWIRWSVLGLIITLTHQLILSKFGLQSYLLSDSRNGLIGLNKEGISSLPGYISIYLLGISIGEHISKLSDPVPIPTDKGMISINESKENHIKRHYEKRRIELILELFSYTFTYWIGLLVILYLDLGSGGVSRRFANAPYVLFISSYNTLFLLGYLLIEFLFPQIPIPKLLESINQNGLLVFLIANLFTGLINISIESMYLNNVLAMLVLLAYSIAVCGLAWLWRGSKRIKI